MPVKIGMVSLGCSKNLVDIERMLYKVREHGYEIVTDPAKANVVIVNTCGFIKEAKEEAIETILELSKLREEGTIRKIIATGCLVQRYKEEFEAEFANDVDAVAGIGSDDDIIALIDKVLADAGFVIRQPGCSACLAMNDDKIPAGKYSVSTSNRNFEGRQGPGARTVLASPLVAAAAAVTGVITDPRELM